MPFKKVVKNLPVNAGDVRDVGSIPGSRRSPGGGHGNPSQYSCLVIPQTEEPGGLQSTDLQSGTQRKELSMHACIGEFGKYFRVKHVIASGTNPSGYRNTIVESKLYLNYFKENVASTTLCSEYSNLPDRAFNIFLLWGLVSSNFCFPSPNFSMHGSTY